MNLAEAFPGKWLKAGHLKGDTHITITGFKMGRYDDGSPAPELSIKEPIGGNTGMALGLNKTNWKAIAKLYGDNTDAWIGKRITVFPTEVEFGGETTMGIRVRLTAPADDAPAAPAPAPTAAAPAQAKPPTFGFANASRLTDKIAEACKANAEMTLDNLRMHLTKAHPAQSEQVAGPVQDWPQTFGASVKEWFEFDRSIPF